MRLRNKAFNLYDSQGNQIQLSKLLMDVDEATGKDFAVFYKGTDKSLKPIRICAIKKDEKAIMQEKKRLKRKESQKQLEISEDTKLTHNYFFVITSLDERFTCQQILELYRLRWQVEMVFKRYKSIINMGSMPTKKKASSEVWLNCKMLIALLIEKLISEVDFSPCPPKSQYLEGDQDLIPFDFNMLF